MMYLDSDSPTNNVIDVIMLLLEYAKLILEYRCRWLILQESYFVNLMENR